MSRLERAINNVSRKKRNKVMAIMFEDLLHPLSDEEVARRIGVTRQNVTALRKAATEEIITRHPEFKLYFNTVAGLRAKMYAARKVTI
jgi:transcriptional regulator